MSTLIPNLMPNFIVEPVLRQARRFSRGSFANPAPPSPGADSTADASPASPTQREQVGYLHGNGGIGAVGLLRQLLEGGAEFARGAAAYVRDQDTAIAGEANGLGQGLGPQPAPSSPNRPLPDRLAAGPPPQQTFQPRQPLPTFQTPPSASSAREPSPTTAPPGQHEDSAEPTASGMASAQRDSIAAQDTVPQPGSGNTASDGTISAMPREYLRPEALPEDDGMGPMRRRILEIQSRSISAADKAQLLHNIFIEGYARSQREKGGQQKKCPTSLGSHSADGGGGVLYEQAAAQGPLESLKFWQLSLGESSTPPRFLLTEDDLKPTYAPVKRRHGSRSGFGGGAFGLPTETNGGAEKLPRHMGCEHYRRNVKLQCNTCEKWYTCRLCHDEVEDHALPRKETKNMLCMPCGYAQKAGDECVRCGRLAARYYCSICKLWNDDPDASTYHCNDCGICRVGAGLGKDFFHCKACGICIAIETKESHRCREGAMDCNCPICGEYMFTSTKRMIHMNPCRHLIHKRCYEQHMLTSYKCPICSKSTRNMESLFRKWDQNIEEQPMPPEWAAARAIIYCNDCEAKSQTLYHWVGLKCSICQGYNTREVQILNAPGSCPPGTVAVASAEPDEAAPDTAGGGVTESSTGMPVEAAPGSASTSTLAASTLAPRQAPSVTPPFGAAPPSASAPRSSIASGPRDIAQPRRNVSHMPGASVGGMRTTLPVQPPERYARSLSPTPVFPDIEPEEEDAMDDDDDNGRSNDMIDFDFWSRVGLPRLGGSDRPGEDEQNDDNADDDDDSEDDDESSEEGDAREDEEDDDNEIILFGHR